MPSTIPSQRLESGQGIAQPSSCLCLPRYPCFCASGKIRTKLKTIPRYPREYDTGDLLHAMIAIATSGGEAIAAEAPWGEAIGNRLFPQGRTAYLRSGRECLIAILQALGLPERARVGVPLYCCASVFGAIAAAGCTPVFLDADLDSYAVDLESLDRQRKRLDTVVIVHTFGYPAQLGEISACLQGRIPIVEDCAHALFSEVEGGLTGRQTEASFFSFGLHKPAAAGGGGAAVFNDSALAATALNASKDNPASNAESGLRELKHCVAGWIRGLAYQRSIYGMLLASPLGGRRDRRRSEAEVEQAKRLPANPSGQDFESCTMRRSDRALLAGRLARFEGALPRLGHNTRQIREALGATALHVPEEPQQGKWNHAFLPVRFRSAEQCDAARQKLLRAGIDSAPIYQNCVAAARHYGYAGDCPKAEWAAQTTVLVPHYASLSEPEVEYIAECLKRSATGNS